MNTSLALIAAKALPALSGSSLTYNAEKNVYLTLGYTSAAGNTYYRAIRLSDRLAVYYHIGQGYAHTFLNGITLFAWNGQKANIIAQKFWGMMVSPSTSDELPLSCFARSQGADSLPPCCPLPWLVLSGSPSA